VDKPFGLIAWAAAAIVVSAIAKAAGIASLVFIASVVGIIPLAALIGTSTEDLAVRAGPRVGGFLNATFGNLPELIVAGFLILGGEIEVVKLAITGAIIGNLLLVLGASVLAGGLRFQEQTFNAKVAGMHATSLALAEVGLIMPALFHAAAPQAAFGARETVSAGVAAILIVVYACSLLFSFRTHRDVLGIPEPEGSARWPRGWATLLLAGSAVGTAVLSEFLVGSLEPAVSALGLSKPFVGLILVPVVGNVAEHASAVRLALRDKMDVAIEIAVGSSTQIALLVAPLLVFFSLAVGKPIDFFFSGFEIAAVGFSTAIVALISLDGRSDWLEGAQLIAAYAIIAISFFFIPRV
jgi:Ca2+:H+ antiporter